eukprot:527117_1
MSSYDKLLKARRGISTIDEADSPNVSENGTGRSPRSEARSGSVSGDDRESGQESDEPDSPKELDPHDLDEHMLKFTQLLRSDVMEMFISNNKAIQNKHQIQIQELNDNFKHQLELKQGEIDALDEDIIGLNHKIEKSHGINLMLAGEIYNTKKLNTEANIRRNSFYVWKEFFHQYKRLHEIEKFVIRPRRRLQYQIRVFSAWRSDARKTHDQKTKERWKNRIDYTSKKLIDKYEKSLAELRGELMVCQNKLSDEEGKRVLVEQNMKRAFMRGVSALNLEAMSMFSRTGGASAQPAQRAGNTHSKGTPTDISSQEPRKQGEYRIPDDNEEPTGTQYVSQSDVPAAELSNVPFRGSGKLPRSPSRKYPRMPSRSASSRSSISKRESDEEVPRKLVPV